jgi:hypothetical protein
LFIWKEAFMEETWTTLEQATQALANTADRAAKLIRQEADRARAEAVRTRGEIEAVKTDVRVVQSEIETVRKTMISATSESNRVRTGAAIAWRCVAGMVIAVVIAVGWTSARLSRNGTDMAHMTARVQDWKTIAEIAKAEAIKLRAEAETARVAQARAEGQLAGVNFATLPAVAEASSGPTTRPTLMSLISGIIDKGAEAIRAAPTDATPASAEIAATDQHHSN